MPYRAMVPALLALLLSPAARADEAEEALARYDERIGVAVERGLEYLANQQDPAGFWKAPGLGSNTGIASLCVMAFLSAGHVPGQGPYGEAINRGIDYVLASQKDNGLLVDEASHGPMYSHGITTLMLCEVSGMVDAARQERVDQALREALKLILAAQQVPKEQSSHAGGWRYQPNSTDADISCAGWQLMSLRAARNCGAPVPVESIDQAVEFITRCANRDGGFAYQPGGGSGFARTGTGVLCLELCGRHLDPLALAGGEWMLAHPERNFGGNFFFYGIYYASQAMFQLGGRYWVGFAEALYPMMLDRQNADGSWPQGSGNEAGAGQAYSTAMSILALSVSYRQLPIYQR